MSKTVQDRTIVTNEH